MTYKIVHLVLAVLCMSLQGFAQTEVFKGKGMFIEDTSDAIKVASNGRIVMTHGQTTPEQYKEGLDLLVMDLSDHGIEWVAVKACKGPTVMEQFDADLAAAFKKATNAPNNDPNKLPKLAGYHVLYSSADDQDNAQVAIDAEIAAAVTALDGMPAGMNWPAGWVIFPSDNYFASDDPKSNKIKKEGSVDRYLNGIAAKVTARTTKLAYSPQFGTADNAANDKDEDPKKNANPGQMTIKSHFYRQDRKFMRDKFASVNFPTTTNKMITVVIPRVYWLKDQSTDLSDGSDFDKDYKKWVNQNKNKWANLVPMGQVDVSDRVDEFFSLVKRNHPKAEPAFGVALWNYESSTRRERRSFEDGEFIPAQ